MNSIEGMPTTNPANNSAGAVTFGKKLFRTNSILAGTVLGGLLAGVWMVSKNFRALGQEDAGRAWLFGGVIATLLIVAALFLLPDDIDIPSFLIPAVSAAVCYYGAAKKQEAVIAEHQKQGGQMYSGWRVFGVVVVSTLLTVVYAIALLLFLPESLL